MPNRGEMKCGFGSKSIIESPSDIRNPGIELGTMINNLKVIKSPSPTQVLSTKNTDPPAALELATSRYFVSVSWAAVPGRASTIPSVVRGHVWGY